MSADILTLSESIKKGSRRGLAKALTLIESRLEADRALALELLERIYTHRVPSVRIGVSGSPGVGKSTFIESLGQIYLQKGHRLAILAIDPSSPRTQGSILGDKTRMEALAFEEACFIRPSPAGVSLGGVARRTHESILLCEAAGYDTIVIETVGVGQSEHLISTMVDLFVCLTLPNAGDQLQGIKKGILELADLVIITKADGAFVQAARRAVMDHEMALHYQRPEPDRLPPEVMLCSALEQTGLAEVFAKMQERIGNLQASKLFSQRRLDQDHRWYRAEIYEQLIENLLQVPALKDLLEDMRSKIDEAELPPPTAAQRVISQVLQRIKYESRN